MVDVAVVPQFQSLSGIISTIADSRISINYPHVHFHLMSRNSIEVCCHGCGTSCMASIDSPDSDAYHEFKDDFIDKHAKCFIKTRNSIDYTCTCPDFRSKFFAVNLKNANKCLTSIPSVSNSM